MTRNFFVGMMHFATDKGDNNDMLLCFDIGLESGRFFLGGKDINENICKWKG